MRFHFPPFAVCQITPPDPEYPFDRDNQASAELICGFFADRASAEQAVAANERRLLAEHTAWQKQFPWMFRMPSWEYRASHYEIVPLLNVEFPDLPSLEQMICDAAVLLFNGAGKEKVA